MNALKLVKRVWEIFSYAIIALFIIGCLHDAKANCADEVEKVLIGQEKIIREKTLDMLQGKITLEQHKKDVERVNEVFSKLKVIIEAKYCTGFEQ